MKTDDVTLTADVTYGTVDGTAPQPVFQEVS